MNDATDRPTIADTDWAQHLDARLDKLEALITRLTKAVEAVLMIGGSTRDQAQRNVAAIHQLQQEIREGNSQQ